MSDRRIIWQNNAALTDISRFVSGPLSDSQTLDFVAAEDYLFIGSPLPFNHLYFSFVSPNALSSTISVDFWQENTWTPVVDLIDETSGWTKDGYVRWSVPRETSWTNPLDSYLVDGLELTVIYNLYWARISFSADLSPTTDVKYMGQLYSNDADMFAYYPDLNNAQLMEQYQAGKTNWRDQGIMATEAIQTYLKAKNIIKVDSQILKPGLLTMSGVHKTAEIIYGGFGDAYKDSKASAKKEFELAIDLKFYEVDANGDGKPSKAEKYVRTGRLYR
jgi:hypothetical protein